MAIPPYSVTSKDIKELFDGFRAESEGQAPRNSSLREFLGKMGEHGMTTREFMEAAMNSHSPMAKAMDAAGYPMSSNMYDYLNGRVADFKQQYAGWDQSVGNLRIVGRDETLEAGDATRSVSFQVADADISQGATPSCGTPDHSANQDVGCER